MMGRVDPDGARVVFCRAVGQRVVSELLRRHGTQLLACLDDVRGEAVLQAVQLLSRQPELVGEPCPADLIGRIVGGVEARLAELELLGGVELDEEALEAIPSPATGRFNLEDGK